jgi:predicted PurR-regulated permease PerM
MPEHNPAPFDPAEYAVAARQFDENRSKRLARGALAFVLFGAGIWTLHEFLPALIWAAILGIATWPFYNRVRNRWPGDKHNVVLPALFTIGIAALFILPLAFVAVELARETRAVFEWIEKMRSTGVPAPPWIQTLPFVGRQGVVWWNHNLATPGSASDTLGRLNHAEIVAMSRQLGSQVAHRLVLFGFTILTLFFIYRDGRALRDQLLRASSRAFGPRGERLGLQMVNSIHGTVDGLVFVGLGVGFVMGVAYAFAGVPHPTLLGGITAVAAMIPFGAPLVFGFAAVLLLMQQSTIAAIAVFAWGVTATFVADHFIRPALIGGATRLPFIWTLLGILGGVSAWGFLGLFLGPAIMATLILLWREYVQPPDWEFEEQALPGEHAAAMRETERLG